MIDALDLTREIDLATPNFQRRQLCQAAHAAAIRLDGCRRNRPGPFFRQVGRKSGDHNARRQTLDVDGEIYAGQRLVKIVDIEEDVLFGGVKGTEIHEMAVAARLDQYARTRLLPKVLRHHGGGTAQEGEGAL